MLALLNSLQSDLTFLPWVSFIAGIGGSLHCVGMCGGLVTSTCQKSNDVAKYQFGRLLAYLFLGFFAGFLGKIFSIQEKNPKLTLIPGLILGGLFLYWGIQNFQKKKAEIPMPKSLSKLYSKLWRLMVYKNTSMSKSFFTGFISIFLPCGLLYGIVLSIAAFEHSFHALITMFFFWLGTLPSMLLAPSIAQKILRPLKLKLPRAYALSLITIGLITIGFRVSRFQEINSRPMDSHATSKQVHSCH